MHVGELWNGIGRDKGYHGVDQGAAENDTERDAPVGSVNTT